MPEQDSEVEMFQPGRTEQFGVSGGLSGLGCVVIGLGKCLAGGRPRGGSGCHLGPEFLVDVIGITPIRSILRRATQENPLTQTASPLFKSICGRCGVHRRIRECDRAECQFVAARLATAPIALYSANINNERFDIVLKTRQF
jgi:hypothetical protein